MNFKIIDNDVEVRCNIIMTFYDECNDINYIIYTDGTKGIDGMLEVYASRYNIVDDNYILEDIENDYEWNLIDNMLLKRGK